MGNLSKHSKIRRYFDQIFNKKYGWKDELVSNSMKEENNEQNNEKRMGERRTVISGFFWFLCYSFRSTAHLLWGVFWITLGCIPGIIKVVSPKSGRLGESEITGMTGGRCRSCCVVTLHIW